MILGVANVPSGLSPGGGVDGTGMGARGEVDRAAAKYGAKNLGRFAFSQLVIGLGLLMGWTFAFGAMVDEGADARRAAKGEGVPGTFTAQGEVCGRSGCSWYGTFATGDLFRLTIDRIELRGEGDRDLKPGDAVPALDVGSRRFVHMRGGSPEWGEPIGAGIVAALAGGLAVGLNAMVLWGVYWTRATPAARRRQARERGRFRLRDLADRDPGGWAARPASSTVRVKVARSKERTLGGVVGVLVLVALPVLFGVLWAEFNSETTVAELVGGSWVAVYAVVLAGVSVQTLRLVLARPRMWVTDDEIVLWDALLLWKVLRIPRTAIAAIEYRDGSRGRVDDGTAQLSPFYEERNLVLRMRDAISLPARRLRWGNWFWIMLTLKDLNPQVGLPQRGRLDRRLALRVKEPRRVAADLDRWLADEEALPPSTPVDHDHGRAAP